MKSWLSFNLRKYPAEKSFSAENELKKYKTNEHKAGIFEGKDKLDLIKRLHDMRMHHVLAQIWKHLPVRDVVNVLQVSSSWNSAILVDLGAMERYIIAKESYDENPNGQESRRRGPLYRRPKISPRKALHEISKNELLSPVKKSPSKGKKYK